MKPLTRTLLIFFILLFAPVNGTAAGGRYYAEGYRCNPPLPLYIHSTYGSHYFGPDRFWISPGFGLLPGILPGTVINGLPRQRTAIHEEPWRSVVYEQPRRAIVYRTPPRTIVQFPPAQIITILPPETPRQQEPVVSRVETTARLLNIRAVPDTDADITGQLRQGSLVEVIGTAPDWLYIKTGSDHYGWIKQRYTRPAGESAG